MKLTTRILLLMAATGLGLSILSHISALFHANGPLGDNAWILHVGIFVVWVPTSLAFRNLSKGVPSRDRWKAALRGCPDWMKYMTYGFFAYAVVNFAIFMALEPAGNPTAGPMPPLTVRGFSGHWMAFYSVAFAVLYSSSNLYEKDLVRTCPNGHPISPSAGYCEKGGTRVG